MEFHDVITTRRAIRAYTDAPIDKETIGELLEQAVQAPSAMNAQNWAFGVIQGREQIQAYGERARAVLLNALDAQGVTGDFRDRIATPDFHPFYDAPVVVVIYTTEKGPYSDVNCSLAAENLMLAARDKGLGTCWIGLAHLFLNDPSTKQEFGVPEHCSEVGAIVIGHPAEEFAEREKEPPSILFWKS